MHLKTGRTYRGGERNERRRVISVEDGLVDFAYILSGIRSDCPVEAMEGWVLEDELPPIVPAA